MFFSPFPALRAPHVFWSDGPAWSEFCGAFGDSQKRRLNQWCRLMLVSLISYILIIYIYMYYIIDIIIYIIDICILIDIYIYWLYVLNSWFFPKNRCPPAARLQPRPWAMVMYSSLMRQSYCTYVPFELPMTINYHDFRGASLVYQPGFIDLGLTLHSNHSRSLPAQMLWASADLQIFSCR